MSRLYPPDHPLGSACLKIKRANVHIKALKRSVDRLFDPKFSVHKKSTLEGRAQLITISINPSTRENWGLIIGDIVANLRASLDHIAWALAMTYAECGKPLTDEQARRVSFPLMGELEYRKRGHRKPACEHILPAARPTIEQFQPYNRRKWAELDLLGILGDLANTDKHRVVPIVRTEGHISFHGEKPGTVVKLNKKGEFQFLGDVTGDLKPTITFRISVYRPGAFRDVDIRTFRFIHAFVRDEVIPAFAGFVE